MLLAKPFEGSFPFQSGPSSLQQMLKICKPLHKLLGHRPGAVWVSLVQTQACAHSSDPPQPRCSTKYNEKPPTPLCEPVFSAIIIFAGYLSGRRCTVAQQIFAVRGQLNICEIFVGDVFGSFLQQQSAATLGRHHLRHSSYKSFPWRNASSMLLIVTLNTVPSL